MPPEKPAFAAAALAAALWACPGCGWAGPADAALHDAAAGGAPGFFDGAPSRPAGLLIVSDEGTPLPSPQGGPQLVEKKAAVAMKASDILPSEKVSAPKHTRNEGTRDGLTTVGGYTSVIGGGLAMAGMAVALPILGVGLLLFLGSRAF